MKWYFNYFFYCNKMTCLHHHCIFCIFCIFSSTMRKLSAFYEQLYILIVSGCLFHPNYSQDMAPVYQREPTKVMDYAIIHKQDSAPKFVIFLTLAAKINSPLTSPCPQNFHIFCSIFLLSFHLSRYKQ